MSDLLKQQKTEESMREIGGVITELLNEMSSEPLGFALIVFEFNNPGIGNYISNSERKSMIEGLKETVRRLENNQDIPAAIGPIQ